MPARDNVPGAPQILLHLGCRLERHRVARAQFYIVNSNEECSFQDALQVAAAENHGRKMEGARTLRPLCEANA